MRPALPLNALVVAPAALTLGACCDSCWDDDKDPPPVPVYAESEPNDDAGSADWMGWMSGGTQLGIVGSVRDDAGDPQDGFAFGVDGSFQVSFSLSAGCTCADLDLWLYDPATDAFLMVFDAPAAPEQGSFRVWGDGGELHLVVVSKSGDADYRLDLAIAPTYAPQAATDTAARTVVLGGGAAIPARDKRLDGYRRRAAAGQGRAAAAVEIFLWDPRTGDLASALLLPTARGPEPVSR
jgi:hypothetical protein